MRIVILLIKALLIGLVVAIIFALIAGQVGDMIIGPDKDGNHYESWIWAIQGFAIGAVVGFIGTLTLAKYKNNSRSS
jgi:branched-subunit amino acid permease